MKYYIIVEGDILNNEMIHKAFKLGNGRPVQIFKDSEHTVQSEYFFLQIEDRFNGVYTGYTKLSLAGLKQAVLDIQSNKSVNPRHAVVTAVRSSRG